MDNIDRYARASLREHAQFQKMPALMQTWILASPNAVQDFEEFFTKGGIIEPRRGAGLPLYSAQNEPRIIVDEAQWNSLKLSEVSEYAQFKMFGTLSHEIGHDRYNTGSILFTGKTADEYVQYRAELEARAISNAYPIFKDLEQHPDFKKEFPFDSIGYISGVSLGQMYQQWRKGALGDQAVVDTIAAQVPDSPYTRGGALQDQNGDGKLTHRDLYLHDYAQYVAPRLEAQAPSNDSINPANPKHPDHAMLEQIRSGVGKVNQEAGKGYDDASERVSRCLLAACKDNRDKYPNANDVSLASNALNRVDHVLMGPTGNIFAVEGKPGDPAHKRAFVSVEAAMRTPVEQSDEKLRAANQGIVQERTLAQQHGLASGLNNPSQSMPTLAM